MADQHFGIHLDVALSKRVYILSPDKINIILAIVLRTASSGKFSMVHTVGFKIFLLNNNSNLIFFVW